MTNMFKLTRTMGPEKGKVFFAMPFGEKEVRGKPFDFDAFYADECVPVVAECGMQAVRGDEIYGSQGVLDAVWAAVQQADLVVADFSTRSANVALEFGWALLLGKRIVVLTQDAADIPADVRGLYRYIAYVDSFKDLRKMREELALQLKALERQPAEEMALMPMPGGSMTSVPARVILAAEDYVVVQDDAGRRGVMGNCDVDYTRVIKGMGRRYPVGTRLDGAFVVDPMRGEMRYTLVGNEIDPWPLLARRFRVGTVHKRAVANVVPGVGAFVPIDLDIRGLVPAAQFGGRLPTVGAEVTIAIVHIDQQRRRVLLHLNGAVAATQPATAFPPMSWRGDGEVVRVVPEKDGRGGYLLVRLPVAYRPAMILVKDMSDDLQYDLAHGHVDVGEEIGVEILSVDVGTGRTLLRDLPEEPTAAPNAA